MKCWRLFKTLRRGLRIYYQVWLINESGGFPVQGPQIQEALMGGESRHKLWLESMIGPVGTRGASNMREHK